VELETPVDQCVDVVRVDRSAEEIALAQRAGQFAELGPLFGFLDPRKSSQLGRRD
jgi:hypothetical protein